MDTISNKEAWDENYRLYKEIDMEYHRLAVHYGLSDSEFYILYTLYEHKENVSPQDIANEWTYSKQTVHSSIKKLEKAGLVVLAADPHSRRRRIVTLTEMGRELVASMMPGLIKAEETAFGLIPQQLIHELNGALALSLRAFRNYVRTITGEETNAD